MPEWEGLPAERLPEDDLATIAQKAKGQAMAAWWWETGDKELTRHNKRVELVHFIEAFYGEPLPPPEDYEPPPIDPESGERWVAEMVARGEDEEAMRYILNSYRRVALRPTE
jgi:hypothetical protein